MIGVYFSGTGNTKHCVTRLVKGLDPAARVLSIEDKDTAAAVRGSATVIFGYPVYYSNLPKLVRDYILGNASVFEGKKIFIVATMGLFSGDGAGCAARLLAKCGAEILGGLHIKMPDCIGDVKLLKKSEAENRKTIADADVKIDKAVIDMRRGRFPREGLNFFYHLAGLFGQRLYFRGKTKDYFADVRVDKTKCVECGLCTRLCPTETVKLGADGITFGGKCTMCYRCFSACPGKAITLLGKEVFVQYNFEDYE